MPDPATFSSYETFWPLYLSQHSQRTTRLIHVTGTMLALLAITHSVLTLTPGGLIAAPIVGYGFAWIAHAFVEHNHPATFQYPLWSLRGDFHMLGLWLTGRLEAELVRQKILT